MTKTKYYLIMLNHFQIIIAQGNTTTDGTFYYFSVLLSLLKKITNTRDSNVLYNEVNAIKTF